MKTQPVTLSVCVLRRSVASDSLQPHGLQPIRLLCPGNFPGKITGVGYHFFLQQIFPTHGSKLHLRHLLPWQADSLPLHHLGSPITLSGRFYIMRIFLVSWNDFLIFWANVYSSARGLSFLSSHLSDPPYQFLSHSWQSTNVCQPQPNRRSGMSY